MTWHEAHTPVVSTNARCRQQAADAVARRVVDRGLPDQLAATMAQLVHDVAHEKGPPL
jgi:hypothetical protein